MLTRTRGGRKMRDGKGVDEKKSKRVSNLLSPHISLYVFIAHLLVLKLFLFV
jgi:hypothetical protein